MKIRMLQAVAGAGFSLHEDQILDSSIVGDELANAWLKDGIAVEDGATETALRNRIADLERSVVEKSVRIIDLEKKLAAKSEAQ